MTLALIKLLLKSVNIKNLNRLNRIFFSRNFDEYIKILKISRHQRLHIYTDDALI